MIARPSPQLARLLPCLSYLTPRAVKEPESEGESEDHDRARDESHNEDKVPRGSR